MSPWSSESEPRWGAQQHNHLYFSLQSPLLPPDLILRSPFFIKKKKTRRGHFCTNPWRKKKRKLNWFCAKRNLMFVASGFKCATPLRSSGGCRGSASNQRVHAGRKFWSLVQKLKSYVMSAFCKKHWAVLSFYAEGVPTWLPVHVYLWLTRRSWWRKR